MKTKKKEINWWDENRKSNEKDYKDNFNNECQHRDRAISADTIECISCGYKEEYKPGANYTFSYEDK